MAVTITGVAGGSPAARAGLRAGDSLLSIGGEEIQDVLDYRFFMAERRLVLRLLRDGRPLDVSVEKGRYDDLGLEFETYLMDRQRSCKNGCVFCFVDQNPKGMRESVYFKDDDDRLSFLFGNYITLTNLTDRDVERIIRMRVSPVNVSVHTTDPGLRARMMRNPAAGQALARLRRLVEGEVRINTQLVLCPGYNDGDALARTLSDLGAFFPWVQSIACVPVGLTGHRAGLTALRPFTPAEAGRAIDTIEDFSSRWLAERGRRAAYPADEFFLLAGRPVPPSEYYGDFEQLENGVGLLALCEEEFFDELAALPPGKAPRSLLAVTGEAAHPLIARLCAAARAADPELTVRAVAVPNLFFGGHITVAGLVTGGDILAAVGPRPACERLLLPSCMLRHEQDRFLDDMPLSALSERLGVPIEVISDGGSLARALLKGG